MLYNMAGYYQQQCGLLWNNDRWTTL